VLSSRAAATMPLLCWMLLTGPAKSRRDDLLAKRDGLRQQQAAAEGQLESQLK
jgi:hypothetical protein